MPHHLFRPKLVLLAVIAGLGLAVSACAQGPEAASGEEATTVSWDSGLSWTQIEIWTQTPAGREISFTMGQNIVPSLDHTHTFGVNPADEAARQLDEPEDGLGSSHLDNLVRDLERASEVCSGNNQGLECSFVSLGYQSCPGSESCDHHTTNWLVGVKANDGLVSDIVFYQLELADDARAGKRLVARALRDYLNRGGQIVDPVEVETDFAANSSRAEMIDRLSQQLVASDDRVAKEDVADLEGFFVIVDRLLG